jgi:hypothetical protein
MFWWERDPTEPDPEPEELDTPEEEFHMAPESALTEPCLIPTDIEDSLSSSSTSSDEFPDERPPRQLSAHPSLRMSTRDTELRTRAPVAFDGSIKKALRLLHSVKAYFTVNTTVYNTDEMKVVTALAYRRKGGPHPGQIHSIKYAKEGQPSMALGPTLRKNLGTCLFQPTQA